MSEINEKILRAVLTGAIIVVAALAGILWTVTYTNLSGEVVELKKGMEQLYKRQCCENE